MNLGIQDAVALADALARVLAGEPDSVLDEYSDARRPIALQVVEMTDRLAVQPALAMRLSGLVHR